MESVFDKVRKLTDLYLQEEAKIIQDGHKRSYNIHDIDALLRAIRHYEHKIEMMRNED